MLFRNGINNVACRLEIGMCFGDGSVQLNFEGWSFDPYL